MTCLSRRYVKLDRDHPPNLITWSKRKKVRLTKTESTKPRIKKNVYRMNYRNIKK